MVSKGEPNDVYRCEVCGAEVAVLEEKGEEMELICCHVPMVRRDASPVAA
jgi:desulfoferrodoxin-like iron-binding protein